MYRNSYNPNAPLPQEKQTDNLPVKKLKSFQLLKGNKSPDKKGKQKSKQKRDIKFRK